MFNKFDGIEHNHGMHSFRSTTSAALISPNLVVDSAFMLIAMPCPVVLTLQVRVSCQPGQVGREAGPQEEAARENWRSAMCSANDSCEKATWYRELASRVYSGEMPAKLAEVCLCPGTSH